MIIASIVLGCAGEPFSSVLEFPDPEMDAANGNDSSTPRFDSGTPRTDASPGKQDALADGHTDAPRDHTPHDGSISPDAETCIPGVGATPTTATASGSTLTTGYAHFITGAELYTATTPAILDLTGNLLPAQIVFSGRNGLDVNSSGVFMYYFQVNYAAVQECKNGAPTFDTEACAARVARDFRCTFFPKEETNCVEIKAVFTSLENRSEYKITGAGDFQILLSARCLP